MEISGSSGANALAAVSPMCQSVIDHDHFKALFLIKDNQL